MNSKKKKENILTICGQMLVFKLTQKQKTQNRICFEIYANSTDLTKCLKYVNFFVLFAFLVKIPLHKIK